MSVTVTVAGTSYTIPTVGETSWGPQVTSWIQAISASTLQTAGGTFTLTGDLNFGGGFGLVSLYYKSLSANIATSGVLRLANADAIGWRNSGNTADLLLKPDADGILQYNAIDLVNLSATQTLTNKTLGSTNTATGITMASWTPDGTHTLTAPATTDTLVTLAATQTLTNKTLAVSGPNTISGLTNSNLSGTAGITNANLNTMNTLTLKANITGGSAAPTDSGLSAIIDACIGSTQGNILYRNSTAWTVLAPGTSGLPLVSGGASANPAYSALTAPALAYSQSNGGIVGYWFVCSSANATVGATYTNNGVTFTIIATVASSTSVFASMSSGSPTSSGTLMKATGTGDSMITFSSTQAMASATISVGVQYAKLTIIGDGGGGGGCAAASNASAGGGGGGGATAIITTSSSASLTAGTTVYFSLASTGGAGGTSGTNSGTAGFGSALAWSGGWIVAGGGSGGAGGSATTLGSFPGGAGGTVSTSFSTNSVIEIPGGDGTVGMVWTAAIADSGNGGITPLGNGSTAQHSTSAAGNIGKRYGSGGGGAISVSSGGSKAGGNGFPGLFILETWSQ